MTSTAEGLIIAAPRSGGGKTTVTLGLLRALRAARHAGCAANAAPTISTWPFTPPRRAGERQSRLLGDAAPQLARLACRRAADADLAIVEGVDGPVRRRCRAGATGTGSAADIAALLGLAGRAGARRHRPGPVRGGDRARLRAVPRRCRRSPAWSSTSVAQRAPPRAVAPGVRAGRHAGARRLAARGGLALPERHLGLVQAEETADLEARLDALADCVAAHVDLDAVLALARPIVRRRASMRAGFGICRRRASASRSPRDAAFSFIYPHLLRAGATPARRSCLFSPLADEPPDAGRRRCWLPGGYPELHARPARRCRAFPRRPAGRGAQARAGSTASAAATWCWAQGIDDAAGDRHAMAGLLSVETCFAKRRMNLGYRRARLLADCCLGTRDTVVHGHEFHYASIQAEGDDPLLDCRDAAGRVIAERGARRGSVSGSFLHVISGEGT